MRTPTAKMRENEDSNPLFTEDREPLWYLLYYPYSVVVLGYLHCGISSHFKQLLPPAGF